MMWPLEAAPITITTNLEQEPGDDILVSSGLTKEVADALRIVHGVKLTSLPPHIRISRENSMGDAILGEEQLSFGDLTQDGWEPRAVSEGVPRSLAEYFGPPIFVSPVVDGSRDFMPVVPGAHVGDDTLFAQVTEPVEDKLLELNISTEPGVPCTHRFVGSLYSPGEGEPPTVPAPPDKLLGGKPGSVDSPAYEIGGRVEPYHQTCPNCGHPLSLPSVRRDGLPITWEDLLDEVVDRNKILRMTEYRQLPADSRRRRWLGAGD